jgi:anti-sigma regulatory factor (Ser/Thr protein kinase)
MTVPNVGAPRLSALHAVRDQMEISVIRVHATALARAHGLDSDAVDRLGIIVGELATNIVRYARSGQIVLRPVGEHGTGCIEILALDRGPGITDMSRVMRGPTGSVPGGSREGGLPSVRRLAEQFDIYSAGGRGTAVVAHIGARSGANMATECAESFMHQNVGVVCVPLRGEDECGDDWAVDVVAGRPTALLVDGLGHGPGAAIAASAAMGVFRDVATRRPELLLGEMHAAMRHTRGAALSVAVVDRGGCAVRFYGIGNVDGRVVTADSSRQLMPQSGIVGHTMPRIQASDVPWPTSARLVMHSDGISSRWNMDAYPGLLARHPALMAGVLFRDFARERDDATALVLRDTLAAECN